MSQQLTKADQIKPLLLASQRQITSLLQDEVKAKKFLAACLTVANDQALNKCDPTSMLQAFIGVAMADLNVDKNIGHAYLVPYGEQVQLQIGYKGMIQLLFRAGWMCKSFPVYQCDEFSINFDGWDNKVELKPAFDDRDEGDKDWVFQNLRGVYVVARNSVTGDEYSDFVSKKIIEKLRLNSPNQRVNQWTKPDIKKRLDAGLPIGIWHDWYVEMSKAKAIKKLAKLLPIGDARVATAIAADDKVESGHSVDYKQTAENGVIIEMSASESTVSTDGEGVPNLDYALAQISECKTKAELDNLIPVMDGLSAKDKKSARVAWMKQIDAIKANQTPDTEPTKEASWQQQIKECGDKATLMQLLDEMPQVEQLKLDELISEKMDSFRD